MSDKIAKNDFSEMQMQVEVLHELIRIIDWLRNDSCCTKEFAADELLRVVKINLLDFTRFDSKSFIEN